MNKVKGFSLIELMVVMGLLIIIISLTAVNVTFLRRPLVCSELKKLHTICMYLQQSALASNQKQELVFNKGNRSYSYKGHQEKLPAHVMFGLLPGAKGPPANPRGVPKSPITFKGERITFHPNGVIKPGTVYLVDENKQFMYGMSCSVAQVSYLRKYRYDGSWHILS